MRRFQIARGVHLSYDAAQKFNRCRISIHFAFPARRETATAHALLPLVMERGYADCPDMTQMTKKLARLYGADLTVDARPMGCSHNLCVSITGIKDQFALEGEKLTQEYAALALGTAFHPYFVGSTFDPEAVGIEKQMLRKALEDEVNDKRLYCQRQANREFFGDSPAGVRQEGYLEEVDGLTPEALTEAYYETLKCIYCQNHEISTGNFGLEISPERLVEIMLELQDQGANNINLVTATHYAHLLPAAIAAARERGLVIPIVYNTSGYERASAVAALGDLVDVWLTDFKYANAALAQSLSHIKDYPRVAVSGLAQMAREIERRGGELVDGDGLMKRGIIVRHLVLPGHADDSCRVLDLVWQTVGDVPISVMNQYTPNALMREQGGDLARAVTREEYEQVLDHADDLGFTTMFWQEGGAVDESFTPAFDTTGVLTSAK